MLRKRSPCDQNGTSGALALLHTKGTTNSWPYALCRLRHPKCNSLRKWFQVHKKRMDLPIIQLYRHRREGHLREIMFFDNKPDHASVFEPRPPTDKSSDLDQGPISSRPVQIDSISVQNAVQLQTHVLTYIPVPQNHLQVVATRDENRTIWGESAGIDAAPVTIKAPLPLQALHERLLTVH